MTGSGAGPGPAFAFHARPNEPVVEVSRWFDAAAADVFDAWTSPNHLCRWWGPASLSLVTCDVDLRTGGTYRYVLSGPESRSYELHGEFVEIDPPWRIVTSFVADVAPGDHVVEVTSFDEVSSGTFVHIVSLHRSCAERDAQLAVGSLEDTMMDQFSRLDALLGRSTPG